MNKKVIKALTIFLILSCVLAASIGAVYYVTTNRRILTFQGTALEESFGFQKKPYCGMYEIVCYNLSDSKPDGNMVAYDIKELNPETSMILLEINLSNYASGSISDNGLSNLKLAIEELSKTDCQLILRFAYDFDGQAKSKEPKDIEIIRNHMGQVAPLVNQYKSSVYLMQGLFVGNWGEMHGSNYNDTQSLLALLNTLEQDIDSSIFFSVRTPELWRILTCSDTPLTADEAYGKSLRARMSLFNDGLLGSATDVGTYDENGSLSRIENHVGKGTRQEELNFQNQLCLYVPNGGEVIIDNPYNDLERALTGFSEMHISYLDSEYDENV